MVSTSDRSLPLGLFVAVSSVATITGAIYGLREVMPALSTGVIYLLAVLLVSIYWPLWVGLLTALASTTAFNFFHIAPTTQLTIASEQNWVALGVYFVVALVTTTLADAARGRADEADRRRREADLTADMAKLLLRGASIEEPLREVGSRIAEAYELPYVSLSLEWAAGDARRRAIPLLVDGQRAGTMLVPRETREAALEALQERVVRALEALIGAARRRQELEAQAVEARALRRSNAAKTSLLRAVSHDLRSPLTAITTAGGGLRSPTLSGEDHDELVGIVEMESKRLSRLIDNLLDLSRLQTGAAEPRSDWCSLDEVLRTAVASTPEPAAGFDLSLEQDLPLIRADATHLERAFANVLENSSRFAAGKPVRLTAHSTGVRVIARVLDHGPGIPKEELANIFEPFHGSRDGAGGGSGLGLAIAQGFVEANGGRLRAESLPDRGAAFVFDLPVPTELPASTP